MENLRGYDLESGEEVVSALAELTPEIASYLSVEMEKLKSLSIDIKVDIEALDLKKSRYAFMSNTAWNEFFKNYPEWHPARKKDKGDYYKFDIDTQTVLCIKRTDNARS